MSFKGSLLAFESKGVDLLRYLPHNHVLMSSGVDGLEALRQLLVFASHRGAHPTLSVRWRLSRLTCPFCAYVEEEAEVAAKKAAAATPPLKHSTLFLLRPRLSLTFLLMLMMLRMIKLLAMTQTGKVLVM